MEQENGQSCESKQPLSVFLNYLKYDYFSNLHRAAALLPERTGKQCGDRWEESLNPAIKKGAFTEEEVRFIHVSLVQPHLTALLHNFRMKP